MLSRSLPSVARHCCSSAFGNTCRKTTYPHQTHPLASIASRILHRTLVTQVSPTVSLLRSEESDNEVYLIGTAHVSEASAKEVTDLITMVQPKTVFIELDPSRAAKLIHENRDHFEEKFEQAAVALTKQLPGEVLRLGERMIGNYIRGFYKTLKRYGLLPGVDMLAAIKAGQRTGATLLYGDRDANDTLRELTATLSPSMLLRAMTTPVPKEIEKTFQQAMMTPTGDLDLENLGDTVEKIKSREYAHQMSGWITQAFPDTAEVLIHRRDLHMAQNLRNKCSKGKVVAVVGIAHMDGIEREWSRLGKQRGSS